MYKTRIIGGSDVEVGDRFPYFTLFYGSGVCGGVLIAPRFVVTAAHVGKICQVLW